MPRIAMTRAVSSRLAACELSFIPRTPIDVDLAREQHAAYCAALRTLGCEVVTLAAEMDYPDSVFVEDTAVVLPELALLTRPGAASRRGEVTSIGAALARWRSTVSIAAPATVDGGDVLRLGQTLYVGQGARSNAAALMQMQAAVAPFGYRVQGVATHGCLHLKSAVTQIAADALLVQPAWIDTGIFGDWRLIAVDPAEAHAANAVRVGDAALLPASFPRTRERVAAAGIRTVAVDVSELQKAEGAVTCCSLIFDVD